MGKPQRRSLRGEATVERLGKVLTLTLTLTLTLARFKPRVEHA